MDGPLGIPSEPAGHFAGNRLAAVASTPASAAALAAAALAVTPAAAVGTNPPSAALWLDQGCWLIVTLFQACVVATQWSGAKSDMARLQTVAVFVLMAASGTFTVLRPHTYWRHR